MAEHAGAHEVEIKIVLCTAHKSVAQVQIFQFFVLYRAMSLINLYTLDASFDVSLCQFTLFRSKKTQNTYGVARFRIIVDYNYSNENNTKYSLNH